MRIRATKPTFQASVQTDGTLELLVYEDIGASMWGDGGVTVKGVKQQIDAAGPHSRIAVRINSPGGDAFEGAAIHNLLRAQGKPVDVYVDGIAASAASVVAMAGDTRTMGANAMMMIHNAWASCTGYADDMRKMADTLDSVSCALAQTYVDRAGLSIDQVKALMDAESWLGAEACMENGLATAIAERDDDADDAALALARSFKGLQRLKTVPATLLNAGGDTKRVDGKDCTKSCFAYRPGDEKENWKLPIDSPDDDEKWEADHIRNAIARWGQTQMPDAGEKDKARDRIEAAAKKHDIDVAPGSLDEAGLSVYEAELELVELAAS